MSKIRSMVIILILGVILATLPFAVPAQAAPMKLLTENAGWLRTHGRLYWTNDFGQDWRDITPPPAQPLGPYGISDVFFLDTSDGWVLLVRRSSISTGSFDGALASTHDGGITWSVTPLQVASPHPHSTPLAGGGSVSFLDPMHGWIDFGVVSSLAFARGLLFSTTDGGATWHLMRGAPQIAGSVRFVTLKDGWLVGGPGAGDLYATHDGGKTWARVALRAPSQPGSRIWSSYSTPVFSDPRHGVIIISNPWSTALTLFSTSDGGSTWEPVAALTNLPSIGTIPATVADSHLITAWASTRGRIRLTVVGLGNRRRETAGVASSRPQVGAVDWLSFRDTQRGWAAVGGLLYATTDGGQTWRNVAPKLPVAPAHPGEVPPRGTSSRGGPSTAGTTTVSGGTTAAAGGGGGGAGSEHTSEHLGFDSCTAPPPPAMQAWWKYGPYYDYGFYLGGVDTGCALSAQYGPDTPNPSLTPATWVSNVVSYGWGLIPFFVGPQAPCATGSYTSYMEATTVSDEESQGAAQAIVAEGDAGNLNLPKGSVIYYDLEPYDQTNTACEAVVAAFIDGWVTKLDGDGYKAGVYTGPAEAQADWTTIQNDTYTEPDDIWVSRWDSRATIWGLGHGLSGGLTDSDTWAEGFRAHQYVSYGPNGSVTTPNGGETYGNIPLDCPNDCIDRDIEYAQVDGGSDGKTYSYCSTCFAPTNLGFGGFMGVNDGGMGQPNSGAWEVVGYIENGINSEEAIDDVGGSLTEWTALAWASGISNLRQLGAEEVVTPGDCYEGGTGEAVYSYPPGQNIVSFEYGSGPAFGCSSTYFWSINDDGMVAGSFFYDDLTSGTVTSTGFVWDSSTGKAGPPLAYSGWSDLTAFGINGLGQVVGQYIDSRGNPHAFIEDNGVYTTINACKGSTTTDVWAINNNEQVVGACGSTEFMYDLTNKTITTVYDPSAGSGPAACKSPWGMAEVDGNSCAWGINDAAQIVGEVSPAAGELWGFIATPIPQ